MYGINNSEASGIPVREQKKLGPSNAMLLEDICTILLSLSIEPALCNGFVLLLITGWPRSFQVVDITLLQKTKRAHVLR